MLSQFSRQTVPQPRSGDPKTLSLSLDCFDFDLNINVNIVLLSAVDWAFRHLKICNSSVVSWVTLRIFFGHSMEARGLYCYAYNGQS